MASARVNHRPAILSFAAVASRLTERTGRCTTTVAIMTAALLILRSPVRLIRYAVRARLPVVSVARVAEVGVAVHHYLVSLQGLDHANVIYPDVACNILALVFHLVARVRAGTVLADMANNSVGNHPRHHSRYPSRTDTCNYYSSHIGHGRREFLLYTGIRAARRAVIFYSLHKKRLGA